MQSKKMRSDSLPTLYGMIISAICYNNKQHSDDFKSSNKKRNLHESIQIFELSQNN